MNRADEVEVKRQKVRDFLEQHALDALILENQNNFAWYTAGGDNHVGTATEKGAAMILVTREIDYVVTSNIEAPRIEEEEVAGVGLDVIQIPWHDSTRLSKVLHQIVGKGKAASDTGFGGTRRMANEIAPLRYSLIAPEMDRYRKVGKATEEAIRSVCIALRPGLTENAIAGMLAESLYARGVTPVVLLIAADERMEKSRHPINTDKKVEKSVMVVCCGRKWGLIVSCTRIVHFGKLSEELRRKHDAVLKVDAALNLSTRVGEEIGSVVKAGIEAYGEAGFEDEWKMHHQGGPTGYSPREFRALPDETRRVLVNQAFAWNPSIAGTKSEDTILVTENGIEFLSPSPDWPMVEVEYQGQVVKREDILVL